FVFNKQPFYAGLSVNIIRQEYIFGKKFCVRHDNVYSDKHTKKKLHNIFYKLPTPIRGSTENVTTHFDEKT
ncbi:hypothetical protein DD592_26955, partial [Enterobacter cloacae complex sp. 2DZ2F20B]